MFYDRFYELCQSMGVTPTQAARDIAIGQSTVSMWKLQGTTPKHDTLRKLAHYFGVSTDYLLDRGPIFDPAIPSRQIIQMMHKKNLSWDDLSQKTGISADVLRIFGFGGKVEDERGCMEKIAKALNSNPAYLMGWTSHEDDEMPYLSITKKMWALSGNDPDAAHGLQQFAEDEEYQQRMDDEENAKRGLAVIKYLEEMGFTVSGRILKSHFEDQINESGQIIGQAEIADEIGTVLSKDGHIATFTDAEFEELQAVAKEAIEGRFYKKVLEQQKK